MLVTGCFIDAAIAADWGLINEAIPDGELDEAIARKTTEIMTKSPTAIRYGKSMFYRQRQMALGDAYAYASDVMARNRVEEDAAEGVEAFLEKRPARWRS
jgi:enoyl-CoA hydratase/carnithine racemase